MKYRYNGGSVTFKDLRGFFFPHILQKFAHSRSSRAPLLKNSLAYKSSFPKSKTQTRVAHLWWDAGEQTSVPRHY